MPGGGVQLPAPLPKGPTRTVGRHDCTSGGGALRRAPNKAGPTVRQGAAPSRRRERVPTLCALRPCRPVGPVPASARAPPHGQGFGGNGGVGNGLGGEVDGGGLRPGRYRRAWKPNWRRRLGGSKEGQLGVSLKGHEYWDLEGDLRGPRGVLPTPQLRKQSPLHCGRSGLRAAERAGDSPVEGRGRRGRIHLSAVFQVQNSVAQAPSPGAPPPRCVAPGSVTLSPTPTIRLPPGGTRSTEVNPPPR